MVMLARTDLSMVNRETIGGLGIVFIRIRHRLNTIFQY